MSTSYLTIKGRPRSRPLLAKLGLWALAIGETVMKKLMIGVALAAVGSASAFAADLPTQTYKSAPVVAQVYNWTGLYVGVNGGYGWGTQDPLTLFSNRFDRTNFNINGGMFGGTIGAQ